MTIGKKILIVDDDRDIVDSLKMVLHSAGYTVFIAENCAECRESLKKQRPDLILLDIMMDTMTDGFVLGMELKNDPELAAIPVIVLSSIEKQTGFPVDRDYLKVDAYLEKPVPPAGLLETIKHFI